MKKAITILGLTTFSIFSTQATYAHRSVNEILNAYYPHYDYEAKCRTYHYVHHYDGGEKEKATYCIDYSKHKIVQTAQGNRLYLIVSGYDMNRTWGWADALAGMFVLKPQGNGWEVESAKPYISVGVNGQSVQEWTLHEFAPNIYGFLGNHEYGMNGGVSLAEFVILTPKGNTIVDSRIASYLNTEATMSCGSKCDDISANIKINRQTTTNGFYPLDITLNGRYEKKVYKNKTYRINYTNKGYITPKNYLLNDNYNQ